MDKRKFYLDQVVKDEDLNGLQDSIENADFNLAKDLGLSGIVRGLNVIPNVPADLSTSVTNGIAYDAYGKRIEQPGEIVLSAAAHIVADAGNERWLTIVVAFDRNDYEQRQDSQGTPLFYRSDEYYKLSVLPGVEAPVGTATRPAPAVGEIILADVHLQYGQATITLEDIDTSRRMTFAGSVISVSSPAGAVMAFARNTPPVGWLIADGSAVSRVIYPALFSAVGTKFGPGDGVTTFNLPDLRGEFIRGWDNGRGIDPNRKFGTWQADELRKHSHLLPMSPVTTGADNNLSLMRHSGSMNSGETGGSETRPRNVALLYCIKY